MLQALVKTASQLLNDLNRCWCRDREPIQQPQKAVPLSAHKYRPLERVVLTDGVARTLFEEFADHQELVHGQEETGWLLLGLREADHVIALATLPAGTKCDASASHVRFNSTAQALGSRIVRQKDRRLTIVGLVHTHPGSLRHPSEGDFRGDSEWVQNLRGREGAFAIGTADGLSSKEDLYVQQPKPNVQCTGEFCFSWYSLKYGEPNYRPIPVVVTLGPDLARPLHDVWRAIEAHAERLERLYRQLAGLTFEVVASASGPRLVLNVPLPELDGAVRVFLHEKEVRYYVTRGEELLATDLLEDRVDRGIYLLLAELAASC